MTSRQATGGINIINGSIDSQWMQHLQDINSKITKAERQIKDIQSKELADAYSKRMQEQQRYRDDEKRRKESEAMMQAYKKEMYDAEEQRMRQEKQMLKNQMAEAYRSSIDEKKRVEQEKRVRDRQDDMRMLRQSGQDINELIRREKLGSYQREMQETLQQREQQKRVKREEDLRAKEEYLQQVDEAAMREAHKQEAYRNYYKKHAEMQDNLMHHHTEKNLRTLNEKDRFLMKLDRSEEERTKKESDDEFMRYRRRQEEERAAANVVREQIRAKEEAKQQAQYVKLQGPEAPDMYNQYLQYQKYEKRENQKVYKEFLDRQQLERENKAVQSRSVNISPSSGGILLPGLSNSKYIHPYSPEARYADVLEHKMRPDNVITQGIERISPVSPVGIGGSPKNEQPNSAGMPIGRKGGSYLASIANNNIFH